MGRFSGFLDRSNSAYNGGNFQDNLMSVAALARMNNVSAPASFLCLEPSCQIKASGSSVRADCNFYQLDNPDRIGTEGPGTGLSREFCSNINPNLCQTLSRSNPTTSANFTTGAGPGCSDGNDLKCVGSWSTVFGVWVNVIGSTQSAALPVNKVDCVLSYGNATILQRGGNTPELSRQTLVKSRYPPVAFGYGVTAWHRIYNDLAALTSPYTFSGVAGGAASNRLYQSPLGLLLLDYATGDSAETVARRIEANFDTATLFAFAGAPEAADRTITYTTSTSIWVYDATALAILLVPFIATVLGLWGRWRVGDDKTVIGYNPVEIARRGLVQGLSGFAARDVSPQADQNREEVEKLQVWGLKEVRPLEGGVSEVVPHW